MGIRVVLKIDALIEKEGLSIEEFSYRTGIPHTALIELLDEKTEEIDIEHITRIVKAFNISDINQIITLIKTND